MSSPTPAPSLQIPPTTSVAGGRQLRRWVIASAVVIAAFAWPLYELVRYSLDHEAHSHILLVPVVSGYFVWLKRKELSFAPTLDMPAAVAPGLVAIALAVTFALRVVTVPTPLDPADKLAFTTGIFVACFVAVTAACLGSRLLRAVAFPAGFLIFMVPMPVWLTNGFESFLQHGSASAAYAMFTAVGTPVFRQELVFQLPGMFIEVAPECSGIRSTIALFITSIVAGYLFLRSPWSRIILATAVIPLALLRNGFRVFTIGELCVHVSPDMIDSFIHHHGGPIFFALSLIPFALLLRILMKFESRRRASAAPAPA